MLRKIIVGWACIFGMLTVALSQSVRRRAPAFLSRRPE